MTLMRNASAVDAHPQHPVAVFLHAIEQGDFVTARRMLGKTAFRYTSPIGTFETAEGFLADLGRLSAILERIRVRKLFDDGGQACAIVDLVTRMDRLRETPVVLWARLKGGRIYEIETFFDARDYAALFPRD